jgi:D-alanine-D-alanine ligase
MNVIRKSEKMNVAIVWGGYSSENEVSAKSARGIESFLGNDRYNIYPVCIERTKWSVKYDGKDYDINKNDFSFEVDGNRTAFDFAYITIHGTPGEDGTLQGYFDMLGIPYSNCGVLASALTFSKYTCNNYLKSFGIKVAESIILRQGQEYDDNEIVEKLGLPMFVKPNNGGSSFATTKVKAVEQLPGAIKEAFDEGTEVIIESFLNGTEVTCGCYATDKGVTVLPLTEVVTHNEFFDYGAKYLGEVEEITPARIADEVSQQIKEETEYIYELIGAKGIIRADYIITERGPVLLEVNTTPGMTATSFIPQQVRAAGLDIGDVLSEIIDCEYNKMKGCKTNK